MKTRPIETNLFLPEIKFMDLAIEVAKKGAAKLEIPVGAVVVHRKTQAIIAKSYNKVEVKNSPLLHAEILALNLASKKLSSRYLQDCDLYTTLEPCPLCAAAISAYRIGRLYYGLQDPKFGAVESASQFYNSKNCFHKPEIYSGIHEEKIRILMKNFFHKIRATKQKEVFRCCS